MNRVISYTSKSALRIIGMIVDALATGPASTVDIITLTSMSRQHMVTFIKHLESVGRIYCVMPAQTGGKGGSFPAMWALTVPAEARVEIDDPVDSFP